MCPPRTARCIGPLRWPSRKAMSACSSTKARRWPSLLGRLATAPAGGRSRAVAPVPPGYLGRLLDAVDRAGVAVPPGLMVPKSGRELEVLALLR